MYTDVKFLAAVNIAEIGKENLCDPAVGQIDITVVAFGQENVFEVKPLPLIFFEVFAGELPMINFFAL